MISQAEVQRSYVKDSNRSSVSTTCTGLRLFNFTFGFTTNGSFKYVPFGLYLYTLNQDAYDHNVAIFFLLQTANLTPSQIRVILGHRTENKCTQM
jgi:hypothetical protein